MYIFAFRKTKKKCKCFLNCFYKGTNIKKNCFTSLKEKPLVLLRRFYC